MRDWLRNTRPNLTSLSNRLSIAKTELEFRTLTPARVQAQAQKFRSLLVKAVNETRPEKQQKSTQAALNARKKLFDWAVEKEVDANAQHPEHGYAHLRGDSKRLQKMFLRFQAAQKIQERLEQKGQYYQERPPLATLQKEVDFFCEEVAQELDDYLRRKRET